MGIPKEGIASLGSMQDTGCLGLVHWDNPEGWNGESGGRGVQEWELMYTRGRFMLRYGKTNTTKEKHEYSILMHIYMEFRKMVTITMYARQQKRCRCTEQTF